QQAEDQNQYSRYDDGQALASRDELLDRSHRSADDDLRMLAAAQASLWHWLNRADCTPRNLSVGYWLLARVYAVLGNADEARRYGLLSLEAARNEPPFYSGYAHEALARAAHVAGVEYLAADHVKEARRYAAEVAEADERAMLEKDLDELTAAMEAHE
ncbi:MAG: hypothetical protein J0M17_27025, partial [Planctomycetes bacterium]|nr:hypothetical protein [Planctomycetota bacterium]